MLASLLILACGVLAGALLGRRLARRRLNEALHELRRPLQALALAAPTAAERAWIPRVRRALADLDRTINGRARAPNRQTADLGGLVEQAARRWSVVGDVRGGAEPAAEGARVSCDPAELEAALDNLICNGLEHGSGPVRVSAARTGSSYRVKVVDAGPGPRSGRAASGADPRRGHGLCLAERAAHAHGGELIPPRSEGAPTSAALELPLAADR